MKFEIVELGSVSRDTENSDIVDVVTDELPDTCRFQIDPGCE